MRTVIVNVGLETGAEYGEVKQFDSRQALNAITHLLSGWAGFNGTVLAHKVEQSKSEQTLILTIEIDSHAICPKYSGINGLNNAFYIMAQSLKQEAIAYYVVEEQKGYLVGEYKENWGNEFNPEYFLI